MKYRGPRHTYSLLSRVIAMATAASPGLSAGGCSLLFVDGPPAQHVDIRDSNCTTSNAWPVVDTLIGGYQLFRVLYATSRTDADYGGNADARSADIFLGATMLLLFAISAGVGYSRVDKCKEAVGWYRSGGPAPRVPTYHRRPSPAAPPPQSWGTPPSAYGHPPAAAPPQGAAASPTQPAAGYPPAPSVPAPVSPPVPAAPAPPPVPQQIDPE